MSEAPIRMAISVTKQWNPAHASRIKTSKAVVFNSLYQGFVHPELVMHRIQRTLSHLLKNSNDFSVSS